MNTTLPIKHTEEFEIKDLDIQTLRERIQKRTSLKFIESTDIIERKNIIDDFKNPEDLFYFIKKGNNIYLKYSYSFHWSFISVILATIVYLMTIPAHMMLYTTAIVWLVGFFGNRLYKVNQLNRKIRKVIITGQREAKGNAVSEEQQKWIDASDKCPACGYAITPQDNLCPDCGLNLS